MGTWAVSPAKKLPGKTETLAEQVERDGGRVLGIFQEPVGDHWHLFCLLPIDRVEATPYQRDLSRAHAKRLQEVIRKIDRFVDPIVAISPARGLYWTPNGHHRLAALRNLKGKFVPAILIPDEEVAYQILALNTEKAHNITLGLLYEQNRRFAGGAFAPMLRRVDKFLKISLPKGLEERQHRAELVLSADEALTDVVSKLKKRGLRHPYVKNFVLARATPLTRARKTLPSFEVTFRKLTENLREFDVAKIRYEDIARSALMGGGS